MYTSDERLLELSLLDDNDFYDMRSMDLDILEALRELRRSNKLFSLQRQCRNNIRRHLKTKADEVMGKLTCIAEVIKSFLLVQDEQPLLEIP